MSAEAMRPAWKTVFDVGPLKVYCDCCQRYKSPQGAQLYEGDICKCRDCTSHGKELRHPGQAQQYLGRLGVDIELFTGQLRRYKEKDAWRLRQ